MIRAKKETAKKEDILTRVVSTAAVASAGVANGRNVPVIIVEEDYEGKIKKCWNYINK